MLSVILNVQFDWHTVPLQCEWTKAQWTFGNNVMCFSRQCSRGTLTVLIVPTTWKCSEQPWLCFHENSTWLMLPLKWRLHCQCTTSLKDWCTANCCLHSACPGNGSINDINWAITSSWRTTNWTWTTERSLALLMSLLLKKKVHKMPKEDFSNAITVYSVCICCKMNGYSKHVWGIHLRCIWMAQSKMSSRTMGC